MKATALARVVVYLSLIGFSMSAYVLTDNFSGTTFFNNFQFFTGNDPTNGYVDYVNESDAFAWGYIKTSKSQVYMGCDSWSISSGRGRGSVRIQSQKTWNQGIFILDLTHMPQGCGTWPAWWLCGPDWPNNGEVDIIEGVNVQTNDQTTLHTNEGCDQSGESDSSFTGKWGIGTKNNPATNCWIDAPNQYTNQGCSIIDNVQSYGAPLNQMNGGAFATLINSTVIAAWFWPQSKIPSDISSNKPNPNTWGKPYARFQLGSSCPSSHFKDLQMIFDLTFCGDWAGSVFSSDCPGKGSCVDFVKNNPSQFKEAYWMINYVHVFQEQ